MSQPLPPYPNWQKEIFLRGGQTIPDRCRPYKVQLATLFHKLKTSIGMALITLAFALIWAGSPAIGLGTVWAQTEAPSLQVTTTADVVNPTDNQTSLREAIGFINDGTFPAGSTITFASGAGEAFENGGTIDLALGQFTLTASMTLEGDLDGDGTPNVTLDAQGASRVMTVSGAGTDVALTGLTLTGGFAARVLGQPAEVAAGGGLRIEAGAAVTFADGAIRDNATETSDGGGVFNAGTLTLMRSEIRDNTAGTDLGRDGGGVFTAAGGATVATDVTVAGNTADIGGGLFTAGALTLTRAVVSGNSADFGGGLRIAPGGTGDLTDTTVAGNSAVAGGGIVSDGVLTATNTTVSGNTAGSTGGLSLSGEATLSNVTVADNSAFSDGGIFNGGVLTAINTTITGNTSASRAAGLTGQGQETLVNTLIVGNTGGTGDVSDLIESQTATLIGGDPAAVFAALGASGGGLLADNGGTTLTVLPLAGGPAINGGTATGAPATDQRGALRPQFGVTDIGAVELRPFDTGQILVETGGAFWYLGPDAIGADLRIYREVAGELPVEVGGLAVRIGLAQDGTVLVQNGSGDVFARPGSTTGIGSGWQQLTEAVTAGDGATWFLGPETSGGDLLVYRWAPDGMPTYADGLAVDLEAMPDGTIRATNSAGQVFERTGSAGGLGTGWAQIEAASLIVTTTADVVDATDGETSLREAIGFINDGTFPAGSTITFAGGAGEAFENGGTIDLALGQFTLTASMTIDGDLDGDGTPDVTLDAQGASRVIYVVTGTSNFNGLILTGGRVPSIFDFGGGLRVDLGATVTVSDSAIRGNHSVGIGGGAVSDGALTLIRTEVSGNSAGGVGGGVLGRIDGTVSLIDTTVSGNTAGSGGGGLTLDGDATLTNVTVANNSADFGGGILSTGTGTLTLINSTLSHNSADGHGGGLVNDGTATLTNSTLSHNSASGHGGGIVNSGTVTLNRTIVSGNTAPASAESELYNSGGTVNGNNHNIIGYGGDARSSGFAPSGTDVIPAGALNTVLNPTLADNGGATLTHALVSDSPAIDIAPTADCENGVLTGIDQRGAARNVDGDGTVSANECDAGAIEHNSLQIPTELRFIGNCEGADLSGNQTLSFTGGMVNLNVTAANGLKCISIGRFDSDHPDATGSPGNPGIATGQWWRINGNIDTGFTVDVTLPFANAGASTRACKWLDGLGAGAGWDCGDDTDNDVVPGVSVTRLNYMDGFSDWAVGDEVVPTAVTFSSATTQTNSPSQTPYIPLLATLLTLLTGAWLWLTRRSTFS